MAQAVIACLSYHRPGFDPRPVSVKSVVDEVSQAQVFLQVLRLSPVSIIPQLFHTHFPDNTALPSKTNGKSLGNCKHSKIISDVEEQWLEKYLPFFYSLKCKVGGYLFRCVD